MTPAYNIGIFPSCVVSRHHEKKSRVVTRAPLEDADAVCQVRRIAVVCKIIMSIRESVLCGTKKHYKLLPQRAGHFAEFDRVDRTCHLSVKTSREW